MKKRYNLAKPGRIILGIVFLVTFTVSWFISAYINASKYGLLSIASYSATFSLIGAILIGFSKEHSESVIVALALNPLVLIIQDLLRHSFWWPNAVALVFVAFIIFTIYCPVNKTLTSIISLVYVGLLVFLTVRSVVALSQAGAVSSEGYYDSIRDIYVSKRSGPNYIQQLIFVIGDYIPQIAMVLVFVFASYEDTEDDALAKVICTISCAATVAFTTMHVVLFTQSEILLEGHQYGAPDKYGDYARGLYTSEVQALDGTLPNLLLIVGIMVVIHILCAPFLKKRLARIKEEAGAAGGPQKPSIEGVLYLSRLFIIVCIIGTVWVAFHYGIYH